MSKHMSSGARRVTNIVLATISTIILVAALIALFIIPGPSSWVDSVQGTDDAMDQSVSPTQAEMYCPAPMGLADTGTYGDSAFQATVGNLSTKARYAAFGSVYTSTVSALGSSSSNDVTLQDTDLTDNADVKTGAQDVDGSRLMDTRMLQASEGTGATGAIASWADDGDLKGVSAATCVSPTLSQSFLLSGTATGTTQQLIVANPSTKPTTVDLSIWGSKQAGKLTLSTQSSLSVPAEGESSLDLSASVSDQDALYVTVSSKETPIAAVVRTVVMDGLTSKGSDFALPLPASSNASVIPSVSAGDEVNAYVFSRVDTSTALSWITKQGLVHAKDVTVSAGKVEVVDLGKAPDNALGVMSTAEDKVWLSAKATRSGESQQADFALINAAASAKYSAVVIPDDVNAVISLANTSNSGRTVTVHAYSADGKDAGSEEITLGANAAQTLALDEFDGDGTAVKVLTLDDDSTKVVWNVRVGHDNLGNGKMAGLATIESRALMPVTSHVWARSNPAIVR
ncbi:hypothetical protein JS530_04915 [Bifidobacterium sp. LC6]|uniref:Organic solvents resistance ABC transporter permease n=1 Tax=Bifidobacterium colobi TaxID=2809026 RepID=A0ABS5UUW1_9BIFI|nr:DUF5719 family protein [Bifidobacterium colobi]MBT1174847.1 hypothetical protein [Bifidobacterium colobi]